MWWKKRDFFPCISKQLFVLIFYYTASEVLLTMERWQSSHEVIILILPENKICTLHRSILLFEFRLNQAKPSQAIEHQTKDKTREFGRKIKKSKYYESCAKRVLVLYCVCMDEWMARRKKRRQFCFIQGKRDHFLFIGIVWMNTCMWNICLFLRPYFAINALVNISFLPSRKTDKKMNSNLLDLIRWNTIFLVRV